MKDINVRFTRITLTNEEGEELSIEEDPDELDRLLFKINNDSGWGIPANKIDVVAKAIEKLKKECFNE